ncbi:MAG TPA: alpha/beta hydrolase [Kofleriaceae bacterium]|nr:alpha/beta hydrolase [Kofleriaceae bacterium]
MPRPLALLIHSGGFTSRQWRKLAHRLAPTHDVLAPDLIGYADDRWPPGVPFHFRLDVDRLAGMLDRAADVVGHSYGGLLALQLALARPELVRSLALYEPVAFGVLRGPGADAADAAAYAGLALPAYHADADGVDEGWLTAFVDWWNGPGAWAALAEPTRAGFRAVAWKVHQEVASLTADTTDRARYGTIAVPTLLLGGGRTAPTERRTLERLAEALPRARLELFPDMGHMGPITHAEQVGDAIAAHLAAAAGSPSG